MAELQEYKCPCCGGAIGFDSGIQKMKCPFCDTEFEMEALKGYDEDLKMDQEDNMNWNSTPGQEWTEDEETGLRSYVCKSCGGEIVGDENLAATECPYCGNPVVMMNQFSGMLKPDMVIPFKLDKKAAKAKLLEHYKGKKLLPKSFVTDNHLEEIKGLYVPFWLFDAQADGTVRYKATNVTHWSDSDYDYTKTSYYSVVRGGDVSFVHIPIDGSEKMADDLMESVEPFNFDEACDFQTAYLAGYMADKYDVSAEDSIERANKRIKTSTEEAFASTVTGYDSVVPENSSINLTNGETKYALYPIWLLNSKFEGKTYTFAMNGQTGKFVGDLPIDKGRKNMYFFKWFGIVAVVAFLVQRLLWLI